MPIFLGPVAAELIKEELAIFAFCVENVAFLLLPKFLVLLPRQSVHLVGLDHLSST